MCVSPRFERLIELILLFDNGKKKKKKSPLEKIL